MAVLKYKDPATGEWLPSGSAPGNGVSSWNDLPDRPFYSEYEAGTVLAETSPVFSEDEGGMFFLTDPITVVTGEEYTVKWNGAEYTCVCGEFDDGNGVMAPVLGNLSVLGGDDTGEPFLIIVAPDELVAEAGFYAIIYPLDGSTELTISIMGMMENVTPIPAKYLTEGRAQNKIVLDILKGTCTVPLSELLKMDVAEIQASLVVATPDVNSGELSVNSVLVKKDEEGSPTGIVIWLLMPHDVGPMVYKYIWTVEDETPPVFNISEPYQFVAYTGMTGRVLYETGGSGAQWQHPDILRFSKVGFTNNTHLYTNGQGQLLLKDEDGNVINTFSGDSDAPAVDTDAIVQEVIAAIGTPVFGTVDENNNIILSGELVNGSYTVKYENADGTTTNIGTLAVDGSGGEDSGYTNLADPTSADWLTNQRIKSTGEIVEVGTDERGDDTVVLTNFIDIQNVQKLHIKGLDVLSSLSSGLNYGRFYVYDSNKSLLVKNAQPSTTSYVTVSDYDSSVWIIDTVGYLGEWGYADERYVRLGGILTGAASDVVITADENIV